MVEIVLLGSALTVLLGLGAAETLRHRRRLLRLPVRLHVAGTRGKSSVTRLLAAGLNHAGIVTVAKTTGTLARMMLPNGREVPVFRPAGANIVEQSRIAGAALELGAHALVLECMALQPELHWVSEAKLVRATHGVITNARADHLDVMGPTEADVARTLAGMVPVGGVLFTAERKHLDILRDAARDRKTRLIAVTEEDVEAIADEEMVGFRYTEHRENVALALRVLRELGVAPDVALAGMRKAQPDPGAMSELEVDFFGRRIVFVNAFAANDPQSTAMIWSMLRDKYQDCDRLIGVFNLRADRASRTLQMARETAFWHEAQSVVLIGTGTYLFARVAAQAGFDAARLVYAENQTVDQVFESIVEQCGRNTLVVGMGNIAGQGLELVRYFRNRARIPVEVA